MTSTLGSAPARTLEEVWLHCDVTFPLQPLSGQATHPFYVRRPDQPLEELERRLLLETGRPPKIFFSGLRGSGKSTELWHLASSETIREQYWPLFISIRDHIDPVQIRHHDILLTVGMQLYETLEKHYGDQISPELKERLLRWRGQVEEEILSRIGAGPDGWEVGLSLPWFSARTSIPPEQRAVVRQVLDRHIGDLVFIVNAIIAQMKQASRRTPLVLLDDLDKPEYSRVNAIIRDYHHYLRKPECAIIYTVSSSLFYGNAYDVIREDAIFLPGIAIRQEDGRPHLEGERFLQEVLLRRVQPDLLEKGALEQIVAYSGGVMRDLMRLAREAAMAAMLAGESRITREMVHYAIQNLQMEFVAILKSGDWPLLQTIGQTHHLPQDISRFRHLQQVLAVLAYRQPRPWYDVHPVLKKVLQEGQYE